MKLTVATTDDLIRFWRWKSRSQQAIEVGRHLHLR